MSALLVALAPVHVWHAAVSLWSAASLKVQAPLTHDEQSPVQLKPSAPVSAWLVALDPVHVWHGAVSAWSVASLKVHAPPTHDEQSPVQALPSLASACAGQVAAAVPVHA